MPSDHVHADNWAILREMSLRDMNIGLAPLGNVVQVQLTKAGTQVTIGWPGDIVAKLARGEFLGGLILADAEQYAQIRKELENKRKGLED